jgi:hypothetical protein
MTNLLQQHIFKCACLLFIGIIANLNVNAQTVQTFTANGSFTVPCGVTSISVQVWGGGGGGAGDGTNNTTAGAGGGGGGYSTGVIAVVPGNVIAYTVGAGGAGGGGATNGGAGGATTFSTVSAAGGGGGTRENGGGGAGGLGNTNNGVAGANSSGTTGGNGGAGGNGGNGGAGGTNGNNGSAGVAPGGGGGGAGNRSGGAEDGAAGGRGQIRITFIGAEAGINQSLAPCGTSTNLAATPAAAGIGTWTCVAGCAGVTITTPTSPTSAVSGLAPASSTTFRWTVTGVGCTASTDDVTINSPVGPACAVFLHGTAGIESERVTNCLQAICTGTYLDDGGAAGNYSSSVLGGLYRVFCPNTAGQCMRMTFNSFSTEGTANTTCSFDYLTIGNGATQNSPVMTLAGVNNNTTGRICGAPAVPFSFTADNPSGCLSFRFTSDASIVSTGWSASLSCVPCATAGNGPNAVDNNDCIRATPLCAGTSFGSNANGPGMVAEGCTGSACPAGGENHTNWYSFQISAAGTLTATVTPVTATDDYDFAIYGPNASCGFLGSPLRCSDSGGTGVTGLSAVAADNVENVSGDKFLAPLNVLVGETYIMMIDEWTANTGGGYSLAFGGTASLDCIVLLPIELISFGNVYDANTKKVAVNWSVAREQNIDYYQVLKSSNGIDFYLMDEVAVHGNHLGNKNYSLIDETPNFEGITYYRLKYGRTGDDDAEYSDVIAVEIYDPSVSNYITTSPNPFKNNLDLRFFSPTMGEANISIVDLSGKIVKTLRVAAVEGSNNYTLDLAHLEAGFYIFQLRIGDKQYQRKIMKI